MAGLRVPPTPVVARRKPTARRRLAHVAVEIGFVEDVAAWVLAEAALHEGLRLYQTMFERSSLGQLILDFPSLRIDVVNKALCRMTGFSVDELVGSDIAVIFPGAQSPATDAAERLAQGVSDGYSLQRFLQRRDGTMLPVTATVSAVRDDDGDPIQLLTVLQDRTQQRTSDEAQRRSEALIEAAVATLPMIFTAFNTDLVVTYVAGGLDRAGTDPKEALGKHVTEITKDSMALRGLRNALAGKESTTRTVVKGETYLTLHGPMCDDDGAVVGVVSVSTNITTEVAAEAARRKAEELRLFVSEHDPLTGLPRRSALLEHLNRLALSRQGAGALLLLDLDDFKVINNSLGYEVGDAVLSRVASRLSDAFPEVMVARCGGDQFAVVVPTDVDRDEAVAAAQRVHSVLDSDLKVAGHSLRVTASVGIAIKQSRASSSTLIGNAASALSHAKEAGPGQFRLYDAQMRRQLEDRLRIQGGLRDAISAGQLSVAYQPIVQLSDRSISAVEALLRWTHPTIGAIGPNQFIPIAEQSGVIVPIGQWVMTTACTDALIPHRDHGIRISVNVSVRQLIGGGFAQWVESVLEQTGLPPGALTLEVTEGALMDDIAVVRTAFNRLRCLGVKVAIDDFGTGYSSLARLQRLPVDEIKLDRAFVTGIDVRAEAQSMAAAILQLGVAIGAEIVAEGVETEAEVDTLFSLGYTAGQGFVFARPMPLDDLNALLRAQHRAP